MISKRLRCAGVALASRHDHARGTFTMRPSARCATIESSVTLMVTIRGSLLTTVLIPCLPIDARNDLLPFPLVLVPLRKRRGGRVDRDVIAALCCGAKRVGPPRARSAYGLDNQRVAVSADFHLTLQSGLFEKGSRNLNSLRVSDSDDATSHGL